VDRGLATLTIQRQCYLLGLSRSTLYYQPCVDSDCNLEIMRLIDEIFTKTPEYGSRRVKRELNLLGHPVGRDLVTSLMRKMGIEAIYPKPDLSQPHPEHKVYPYILRGVKIEKPDHVWSTDITYIRMKNGFLYLTAVIDWHSRYVLAWRLSNSLDGLFCRQALLDALEKGKPEVFNTDQGAQFTSKEFQQILEDRNIKPSMDGRGRALDNVFVERWWRSVKYENIFVKEYQNGLELHQGLGEYFTHYNERRPHMSLKYACPAEVYWGK